MDKPLRTCTQCLACKEEGAFRQYYGNRKGTYTRCKVCERVNAREKYLMAKAKLSGDEEKELESIHQLWSMQRSLGGTPPKHRASDNANFQQVVNNQLLSCQEVLAKTQKALGNIPIESIRLTQELQHWLIADLYKEPEHYLDVVFEALQDKYRPLQGISPKFEPIRDDTYKAALDAILARFCAYEDDYYKEVKASAVQTD